MLGNTPSPLSLRDEPAFGWASRNRELAHRRPKLESAFGQVCTHSSDPVYGWANSNKAAMAALVSESGDTPPMDIDALMDKLCHGE